MTHAPFKGKADAIQRGRQRPQQRTVIAKFSVSAVKQVGGGPRPIKLVVYGGDGVGKSSFAAGAPGEVFLDCEDGLQDLNPRPMAFPYRPETWADVKEALISLTRDQHSYQTFVVDTLDWLHMAIARHVHPSGDLARIDYGKGFTAAFALWKEFYSMVDTLIARRGMNVVLVAHAMVAKVKDPAAEDYDRWTLKLMGGDKQSKNDVAALTREWAQTVLFASKRVQFKGQAKYGSRKPDRQEHVVYTTSHPAYDAKNRWGLPPVLALDWDTVMRERAYQQSDARRDELLEEAERLHAELPEHLQTIAGVDGAGKPAVYSTLAVAQAKGKVREFVSWAAAQAYADDLEEEDDQDAPTDEELAADEKATANLLDQLPVANGIVPGEEVAVEGEGPAPELAEERDANHPEKAKPRKKPKKKKAKKDEAVA